MNLRAKIRLGQSSGYTFVELLVVLAILIVLALVLFAGVQNYAQRQTKEAFILDVRSAVENARANTLARVGSTSRSVYVGTTSLVTFFGDTYSPGDSYIEELMYPPNLYATTTLSDGGRTITFAGLTGTVAATGTIYLVDAAEHTTSTMIIYDTGLLK